MSGAIISDINAQLSLNRYDLNQDGFFSGAEITPEQKQAMKNLISDTGRNFSFITGLVFSAFITVVILIFGKINERFRKTNDTSIQN